MVHFVIDVNGQVEPLCGEWRGTSDWTTLPNIVSCARCLARLEHEQPGEPPPLPIRGAPEQLNADTASRSRRAVDSK